MQLGIVTLFPEMFAAISEHGISGRAVRSGLMNLELFNPRDYTSDKHRTVDDKPFGGGPGMLMKTEPLIASIAAARQAVAAKQTAGENAKVIYLSPQGKTLKQDSIIDLAKRQGMVLLCGRYQGIDNRVLESEIDEEWSLGDFVISGGELAAMTLIDAMTRFQPGALGDEGSALEDSFSNGLLHSPEYTRPQIFKSVEGIVGESVPSVLLSGNHEAIRKWQLKQSLGATWLKRPDLLKKVTLEIEQKELLEQFKQEYLSDEA